MILIAFFILFLLATVVLYFLWERVLLNKPSIYSSEDTLYTTDFIKGTARGFIGKFASNSDLESIRKKLNQNNSKF